MKKQILLMCAFLVCQQMFAINHLSQALFALDYDHAPNDIPLSAWHQTVQSLRDSAGQVLCVSGEDLDDRLFTSIIATLTPVIREAIGMIDASNNHLTQLPRIAFSLIPNITTLNLDHNHILTLNGIEQLHQLTLLRIQDNPLNNLPAALWSHQQFIQIYIDQSLGRVVPDKLPTHLHIHYTNYE
jgi:hypothetical protein